VFDGHPATRVSDLVLHEDESCVGRWYDPRKGPTCFLGRYGLAVQLLLLFSCLLALLRSAERGFCHIFWRLGWRAFRLLAFSAACAFAVIVWGGVWLATLIWHSEKRTQFATTSATILTLGFVSALYFLVFRPSPPRRLPLRGRLHSIHCRMVRGDGRTLRFRRCAARTAVAAMVMRRRGVENVANQQHLWASAQINAIIRAACQPKIA
jgi:hypothetical protein